MLGRRGPGLVRAAATTAVVAGTAGAVRHHQDQKYAQRDYEQQMQYEQQMAAQQQQYAPPPPQYAEPAAPAEPDYMAELQQLSQLRSQGIITDEEFEAKKKQLLGI
jgi:hypothetical protein